MTETLSMTYTQFGLTGFLLILTWKVLDIGKQLFLANRGATIPQLACQNDPVHFQRIKDMHHLLQNDHGCQWKDRDEVRDLLELTRQQIAATKDNTRVTLELASELRRTRNGN